MCVCVCSTAKNPKMPIFTLCLLTHVSCLATARSHTHTQYIYHIVKRLFPTRIQHAHARKHHFHEEALSVYQKLIRSLASFPPPPCLRMWLCVCWCWCRLSAVVFLFQQRNHFVWHLWGLKRYISIESFLVRLLARSLARPPACQCSNTHCACT